MPEPVVPTFEQVRWKLADEMTDQDIEILLANKDKLNQEEQDAFAEILQMDSPADDPSKVLDQEIDKAVEHQEDNPENPENPDNPQEELPSEHPEFSDDEPANPQNPEQPQQQPITTAQLDTYLEGKRAQWDAEGKTKAEQKTAEDEIKFNLFQKDEIPEDWNAALNKFGPVLIKQAEDRIMARIEARDKKIAENQQKMQQEYQKTYKTFEQQFNVLAEKKFIPNPKTHPKEYKEVHDQIIAIGDAHKKANIYEAYNLWRIIPVDHGGGLMTGQQTVKQQKIEAQKERAGRVQSGAGGIAKGKKGPPEYNKIHNTNMDDLLEARLQQA